MHGGGSSKIGGVGPGDKFSYMIGLCTSINHDGCCCPTAAMVAKPMAYAEVDEKDIN
jgi:hypothetical protein